MTHLAPRNPLWVLFVLCVLVFLVMIPMPRKSNMLIGADGISYYMYVRSLVIDGDLNFANEYDYFVPRTTAWLPPRLTTPTGKTSNLYAVGPALLWLPFYLVAHASSALLRLMGAPAQLDGYGYIYQAAVCLGSVVYGYLGILLTYRTARKFYPSAALAACLLIWFATNLIYYQIMEASMAHMCSFFAVALLIALWLHFRDELTPRQGLWIGLASGLVGIVRQPDLTFFLLPILDKGLSHHSRESKLKFTAAAVVGFLLVFSIQMGTWQVLYGRPWINGYSYSGYGFTNLLSPKVIQVLFSTQHGLFLWHPILLLAGLGFIFLWRRDRILAGLLSAGFLIQVCVIGAWVDWAQGDAFGGRMFIASFPILALGLSAAIHWAIENRHTGAVWVVGAGLVAWNLLFLVQYRLSYIPHHGPLTFDQLVTGKYWMLVSLGEKILH